MQFLIQASPVSERLNLIAPVPLLSTEAIQSGVTFDGSALDRPAYPWNKRKQSNARRLLRSWLH